MFERVRLARALIHFAREHLPGYESLLEQDLRDFSREYATFIEAFGPDKDPAQRR